MKTLKHGGATSSFLSRDVCRPDDQRPEVRDQFENIQTPEEFTLMKRKGPEMDVSPRQDPETHQEVSSIWVPIQGKCSGVPGATQQTCPFCLWGNTGNAEELSNVVERCWAGIPEAVEHSPQKEWWDTERLVVCVKKKLTDHTRRCTIQFNFISITPFTTKLPLGALQK